MSFKGIRPGLAMSWHLTEHGVVRKKGWLLQALRRFQLDLFLISHPSDAAVLSFLSSFGLVSSLTWYHSGISALDLRVL